MSNTKSQHVFSVHIKGGGDEVLFDNDDIFQLYFIEDIFSHVKSGKMIFEDQRGIHEHIPLVGDELLTITYGSIDNAQDSHHLKKVEFEVFKVGEIENTNDKRRHLVEIFFCEEQHKALHYQHFSASYKCLLYTDIVREICEKQIDMTAFNKWEDCVEEIPYFYNALKTPAQNIKYLLERCSSAASGQPGYLLYSNTQDPGAPFNLVSLETLLAQGSPMPPGDGIYTMYSHNEFDVNKIIKYKNHRPDKQAIKDLIHNFNLGYDIKRKRYLLNEYEYGEGLDRFTSLGDYSLFNSDSDHIRFNRQDLTCEVDEDEVMKNMFWGNWVKRYSLANTISITLEGHSERYAGGMIKIIWPSSSDEEPYDKQMVGLFLVKSITHNFVPSQQPVYTQKMNLIKNGYNDTSGNVDPAGKTNTVFVDPWMDKAEILFKDHIGIRGV